MTTWKFDPLTYQVAWRAFGVDRPHYPFQYRPTTETADEYERECLTAAKQFQSQLDDDLYWTFATMLNPEARVYACGFTGQSDNEKVRVFAAVRGAHAVVVHQDAGPDHQCGGEVRVMRIPQARCGEGALRGLPSADAGRHARVDVDLRDLENDPDGDVGSPESWLRSPSRQATPKHEFEQLLDLPRVGSGRVEVYSGATVGERDTGRAREVRWIDVAEDGRYLVAQGPRTVSILPGRGNAFAAHVQKLITAAAEENRSELPV